MLNDLDDISELFSDSQVFGRNAAAAGSGGRYKKKGRARESGADSSEGDIDVLDDSQGDEPLHTQWLPLSHRCSDSFRCLDV